MQIYVFLLTIFVYNAKIVMFMKHCENLGGLKMAEINSEIIELFCELDEKTQEKIISAAAASIQEQLGSQSCSGVPQKADSAYR